MKYFRHVGERRNEKADIVTFGSIRERELSEILPVLFRLKEEFPSYRMFVAPRDLSLVSSLEGDLAGRFCVKRYSSYRGEETDFVIVDTVGDLLQIYGMSKVAFVGGSLFPYGGQNILEPLFFGTPVLFGPHVENFKEIAEQVASSGAGKMVQNGEQLLHWIRRILRDEGLRQQMGMQGKRLIEEQERVMEHVKTSLLEIIGAS
jgi:3-deoxy-D-manno-octulosonic-acid transferase